ncbi:hypothetical protein [Mesorhizobium waimense]|uniref:hypothetical protein n=1 Tax=Mesorhizobium waimense TaxID=1300307 RepID=UPI0011C411A0|nr:hypothetical protein [Mesorhizobium waimense]
MIPNRDPAFAAPTFGLENIPLKQRDRAHRDFIGMEQVLAMPCGILAFEENLFVRVRFLT